MRGLSDATYTATDPGWGVWFVLAFLLGLGALLTGRWIAVTVLAWLRTRFGASDPIAGPQPIRLREARR